jgi:ABC-type transport system involved in cytochrome c biogenesis ATPase subunit
VLNLKGLACRWGSTTLFHGLTAQIPAGVTLVCGDESTGKTTLLRLLAGALQPHEGELLWTGPAADPRVFWVDAAHADHDPVPVAGLLGRWSRTMDLDGLRLDEAVEDLNLAPHLSKPMHMLSTGSRRKVGLAAAMASRAPLVLLDQPFAALDLPSERRVVRWLEQVAMDKQQACVIADYLPPPGVDLALVLDLDLL